MALPAEVTTATVTAKLTSFVVDGSDVDVLPDMVPLTGQVTFTPDRVNGALNVPTATPPLTGTVRPAPFNLAGDGSLSANLVVIPGATYTVSFALNGGVSIAPFSIGPLVAGQSYDLSNLAPTVAMDGVAYVISPATDASIATAVGTAGTATRTALDAAFVGRAPAPSGGDDTAVLQALCTTGSVVLRPNSIYLATALTLSASSILDLNGSTLKKFSGGANLVTAAVGSVLRNGILDSNALGGSLWRNGVADAKAIDLKAINGAAGTGFDCNVAVRPKIIRCDSNGMYYGVLLNVGTSDALVMGGTHTAGTANTSYEGSLYIPNAIRATVIGVTVTGAAGHGAWIGGATTSDINLSQCSFVGNGTVGYDHRGVTIDSSCQRVTLTGCRAENNIANGFFATGTTKNITLTACTARNNNLGNRLGAHGFEILADGFVVSDCISVSNVTGNVTDPCGGFYFGGLGGVATNCRSDGNYGAGFRAFDARNISLTGCMAVNNSVAGSALYDGFELNGSYAGASLNLSLIGCRSFDNRAPKLQRYGASISSSVNQYQILGCNFLDGGLTGNFLDGGGVTKSVANNL